MAYVVIHRMFSLPVSLPVRGADGLAKRAVYGGVERQRLSSQINSRELAAGVFYLSVVIDLGQLRKNCAGWSDVEVAKVVGWLVKSVATVTPAAMLGSTAPFTDPGEVVVEVTNGQPVNAMGAFERPVAPTLDASVVAFNHHMQRVWSMIGHPAKVLHLSEFIDSKASSPAVQRLADAVANAVPAMA